MEIFVNILSEMIPLYVMMLLGYLSGKFFKVDTKHIATLAVFVISPVVFMLSVQKMQFSAGAIWAPVVMMLLGIGISLIVLNITKLYMGDKTPYLSALMSGTSNWGYFGMPLAFALFDPNIVALYVLIGFGTHLFENSFGIYYISRGSFSPLESFKNIFKFPVIYAILIGLCLSYFNYQLPVLDDDFFQYFKGAYVVLGMMIIGLGIANMERFTIDKSFIATVFAVRFVIWPLIAVSYIWFDKNIVTILGEDFYKPLLLFSVMPMGANNIAFAAKFDMNPGKASVAALASTFFAMLYVPLALNFLDL
tara:strand:- start:1908 stop:2828 length:921 start_codon:yes stop_codon:yes gene_type:complete